MSEQLTFTNKQSDVQFDSLEQIEEMGLTIIYPHITPKLTSKLKTILAQRHISQTMLSYALSVPRGTLSGWIIKPDLMPLSYAIKIAKLLDISVEEMYTLTDEAWAALYPPDENLYLDLYTLKMIPGITYEKQTVKQTWYDTRTKEVLTPKERREMEIAYVQENAVNPGRITNNEKSTLKEAFSKIVVPRYVRLARKITPYTL